jgi:flavin reductase (DIM6/NTAB) family NADH-FMN oxidoreductase RutF
VVVPLSGSAPASPGHVNLDPMTLRRAFGTFPTGVAVVAAKLEHAPIGMTANSFTSVSLNPPMVSICIARTSTTWPKLRCAQRIGVNVLSARQHTVCQQLASRTEDRFQGLDWEATASGSISFEGACAWFDCSLDQEIEAGDHRIAVLRLHDLRANPEAEPLVFHVSTFRTLNRTTGR